MTQDTKPESAKTYKKVQPMKFLERELNGMPIVLDVPSCKDDCPFNQDGTICRADKDNHYKFSLKEFNQTKYQRYPDCCPLEDKK